jgi:hypothetical protein
MPKMRKEADVNFRRPVPARSSWNEGKPAESAINVYASDPREMCET